jgi:2-amino-4-hydroxy-6-hydroxymethyldihydropteridine diphosphokinase
MSSIYETAPVGVPEGQPRFLNAAATGSTRLQAPDLLAALLAIEEECGRERPFHLAPRTLDLDLILFGEEIIDRPGLIVPHPRFRERAFVLEPLAEIAPDLRDPVTGKTVRELRDAAI